MHRRKCHIILRPSPEYLLSEMRMYVTESIHKKCDREPTEDEIMEAERLFLLAAHPLADEILPTAPQSRTNDSWAEPGWKLNLDVPVDIMEFDDSYILPRRKHFPVQERLLSEFSSAPGRQAASFLQSSSHLNLLTQPMSAFALATSPAETNSVPHKTGS